MYAVVRETTYPAEIPVEQRAEFQEFQQIHAQQHGYRGTIVTNVGDGRYYTITLWNTAEDMHAARTQLGPVVQRLLDPLMSAPSRLLGTGPVVVNDLCE